MDDNAIVFDGASKLLDNETFQSTMNYVMQLALKNRSLLTDVIETAIAKLSPILLEELNTSLELRKFVTYFANYQLTSSLNITLPSTNDGSSTIQRHHQTLTSHLSTNDDTHFRVLANEEKKDETPVSRKEEEEDSSTNATTDFYIEQFKQYVQDCSFKCVNKN